MTKKCNKLLAVLLAFALVITTFGIDWACVKVFAEEGADEAAVTTVAEAGTAKEVQSEKSSDDGGDDKYVEENEEPSEEVAPEQETRDEEIVSKREGEELEGEDEETEGDEPEVTEVTVHIIGKKARETFDGELKSVEGYIISFDEQSYDEIARNTAVGTVLGTVPEGFDVKDIKCTKDAKAQGIAPDTYPMGLTEKDFSYAGDNTAFTVTFDVHDGELEIVAGDKIPLTITSENVNSVYNGEYQTYVLLPGVDPEETEGTENSVESAIDGIRKIWKDFFIITADAAAEGEVEFLYHGQKYVATNIKIKASGADYGTYDFELVNPISDIRIRLGEKDVTECFELKARLGVLNIDKAKLTITALDNWKYVNTTDPELELSYKGLVGYDSVDGMFKAVRDEGETVRTYPIHVVRTEAEEGRIVEADLEYNVLDNYELETKEGTFTIRARTNPNPPSDDNPSDDNPPGENPTGDPGTPSTPAETPAPSGVVLGATRGNEQVLGATRQQAAVLGARRGRTEDSTNNLARMLAILIAGAVSVSLLATGRKKDEEEQ